MEPTRRPPFVVALDDCDDLGDVIDLLGFAEFVAGAQPFARNSRLTRVRADASLLPPGTGAARVAEFDGRRAVLGVGDGWTVSAVRWRDGTADVTVTASTPDLVRQIFDAATEGAVDPASLDDNLAPVGFWHLVEEHPRRAEREVAIEPWATIRRNYSVAAGTALDRVMAMDAGTIPGRLLLLHGPPGTGKTTAIRALAHAWRDWCSLDVVIDPERLLTQPSYLLQVALDETDSDGDASGARRWRMLVLEDCDELIRSDAKSSSGPGLARLLNVTDGFLGQGLRLLVAVTTNEPLWELHRAIVRPGRCLAEIYVGRLPRSEAAAWLGTGRGVGPDGATLAELFELQADGSKVERREPAACIGQYL